MEEEKREAIVSQIQPMIAEIDNIIEANRKSLPDGVDFFITPKTQKTVNWIQGKFFAVGITVHHGSL